MEAEAALGVSLSCINSTSSKDIILISLPFPALGELELWCWRQIQLTKQRDADLSQVVILALICFRGEIFLSFLYKDEITNK